MGPSTPFQVEIARLRALLAQAFAHASGVTAVTASAPLTSTGGATPNIAIGAPVPIADGGTGQATANAALNALLPSQGGNNGKVLGTNGTDAAWVTESGGGTPVLTTILDNVASNGTFAPLVPPTNWTAPYTPSKSGAVRIDVGASGFTNVGIQQIDLILQVDGVTVKTVSMVVNASGVHRTFPPLFWNGTLTPGAHTINVTVSGATGAADNGDFCSIMVTEY